METPQQPVGPEYSTGQVPPPPPAGPTAQPAAAPPVGGLPAMFPAVPGGKGRAGIVPRSRRARLTLAVIGGVLALLCFGGIGITFVLYDDATKIDRGSPDVAVDNFLRAYLVNRDDGEAALFRCAEPSGLSSLSALRDELTAREKEFNVKVTLTWSSLIVAYIDPTHSSVKAGLVIAGSSGGRTLSRRTEQWAFDVVDDNGWRVCGGTELS